MSKPVIAKATHIVKELGQGAAKVTALRDVR